MKAERTKEERKNEQKNLRNNEACIVWSCNCTEYCVRDCDSSPEISILFRCNGNNIYCDLFWSMVWSSGRGADKYFDKHFQRFFSGMPFMLVSIVVALIVGFIFQKVKFNFVTALIVGIITGIVAPIVGTPIGIAVYGGLTGTVSDVAVMFLKQSGAGIFTASFIPKLFNNLIDKIGSILIVYLVVVSLPGNLKPKCYGKKNR